MVTKIEHELPSFQLKVNREITPQQKKWLSKIDPGIPFMVPNLVL
jgi:hypothetical protein